MKSRRRPYDFVKRLMDVFASALGLIVTAPIQLAVAALVAIKLGRPVLFTQDRPGLHGQIFRLYKFRSMKNPDPQRGLVADADRLTAFGRILRSSSLDELPSLWNVLRGDMSLVGPRPLRVHYLERYSERQHRRHEVRPGITGLAQVAGRNLVGWPEKLELDVRYVDSRGAALDTRILLDTVTLVLKRSGISAASHATAPEFTGEQLGQGGHAD